MKNIEKSVFGSFFIICEFDSDLFCTLNGTVPYIREYNKEKYVDVIKITPCGKTKSGNTLFCFELLER